jgi:hypothetical protein
MRQKAAARAHKATQQGCEQRTHEVKPKVAHQLEGSSQVAVLQRAAETQAHEV